MTHHRATLHGYDQCDRYDRADGRVFLMGSQALLRIMLDQARPDRATGRNTDGFVSGRRGSPPGGAGQEMWRGRERLDGPGIRFLPAVNEDPGATAMLGAQQTQPDPHASAEGGAWNGRATRSGAATPAARRRGGVPVVAGDDHGRVVDAAPVGRGVHGAVQATPSPASIADFPAFWEHGIALSWFWGTWVGFEAISETVASGRSLELPADRVFARPGSDPPPGGPQLWLSDLPKPEIELQIAARTGRSRRAVPRRDAGRVSRAGARPPMSRRGRVICAATTRSRSGRPSGPRPRRRGARRRGRLTIAHLTAIPVSIWMDSRGDLLHRARADLARQG